MDLVIDIVLGDMMKEPVDVIVNPANPRLIHGGGLCGIIYNAVKQSGEHNYAQLTHEISLIPAGEGKIRCNFGEAVMTHAPGLPFKAIIHTVGAMAKIHSLKEQNEIIINCYYNSMVLANSKKFKSIAFPLISAGIYGVDKALVAHAFMKACKLFMDDYPERTLNNVKLIVIDEADLKLF